MTILHPHGDCWYCNTAIACDSLKPEAWPHWSLMASRVSRGRETFEFVPCCALCAAFNIAMNEASEAGRRFTEIWLWERCNCGRAEHPSLGRCVLCWQESRMLSRQLREVRATKRIAQQLKRKAMEIAA